MTTLPLAQPREETPRVPGSVPDRVLAALRKERVPVRPVDIAKTTGLPTSSVANALRTLTLAGEVERIRKPGVRNGPGASRYVLSTGPASGTD